MYVDAEKQREVEQLFTSTPAGPAVAAVAAPVVATAIVLSEGAHRLRESSGHPPEY